VGKKFDRLMEHVAREYEDKGYGKERAEKIGAAVAGKVARIKGESSGQPDPEPPANPPGEQA
jgi:hypothetical protein